MEIEPDEDDDEDVDLCMNESPPDMKFAGGTWFCEKHWNHKGIHGAFLSGRLGQEPIHWNAKEVMHGNSFIEEDPI